MSPELSQHALEVFEAFLQHTREGSAVERTERTAVPQPPATAASAEVTERTPRPAPPSVRPSSPPTAHTPSSPPPPAAAPTPARGSIPPAPRVDDFVLEMTVLIKYGHAEQVPREIDRWIRAHPEPLTEQLRVAEFELSRVDAAAGLDRMYAIAARALDRGDADVAGLVLERVRRVAPGDLRVIALSDRVGSR